jgi:hypothetical protein
MDPILTYIAPSMKSGLRLIQVAGTALILLMGCNGNGVGPSDDIPVLSNPQSMFDDRDNRFYAAVTLTLPSDTSTPDSLWVEMFQVDTSGLGTAILDTDLVDDGTGGDILPQDDVYARKFDSPLPVGTSGIVYFDFYALIAGDTSSTADTLSLNNLRPVIIQVTAADSLRLPPEGYYVLDTIAVEVVDPDGLDDIRDVSFTSLKPDSTLANQGQPISLADNGDASQWGDQTAGDGIYSRIVQLPWNTDVGTYVYRFTAKDLSGLSSDTTYHSVVVH